jgi:uncharacterized protein (DUF2141 family)
MKMNYLLTLSLFFGALTASYSQNIKVKIQSVKKHQGTLHVALCNNPDDFMSETYKQVAVKVPSTGEATIDFSKIPQGKYAIRVYVDTDNSGDLTTNLIGIPEEPFGFSNNPRIKLGPPTFEAASFDFKNDINLTINLLSVK